MCEISSKLLSFGDNGCGFFGVLLGFTAQRTKNTLYQNSTAMSLSRNHDCVTHHDGKTFCVSCRNYFFPYRHTKGSVDLLMDETAAN